MIRPTLCAAMICAMLVLPACSRHADEDSEGFRPPVVEARGDFLARQERRFRRLDKDSDGDLVAAEFPARRPERVRAFDTDGNGQVSRSEFVEGNLKRFDAMDPDKNGEVTPEERRAGNGN